jgi:putative membrane protein
MNRLIVASVLLAWLGMPVGSSASAQLAPAGGGAAPSPRPGGQAGQAKDPANNTKTRLDPKGFVAKVSLGGATEVEAGTVAATKASNADVKAFARRMVDDHSKAGHELMLLAREKGITVTDNTAAAKASLKSLEQLSGDAFDRAYMDQMVANHEATVEIFKSQIEHGKDQAIRDWAEKTLPTVREHLELAKKTRDRLTAATG